MSLFVTPAESAANPPSSWLVVKVADRRFNLTTADGGVLNGFSRKRDAEEAKVSGFFVDMYEKEVRWYAGETTSGMKSWAECLAERERTAAWLAAKEAS